MGFDLSNNNLSEKAEEGFEFELLLPKTEEPTGAFFTVRGTFSKKVKEHSRRLMKRYQQKEEAAKRKGKTPDLDFDELEDTLVDNALVRLLGWRGIEEKGKELEFTPENARRVLKEHIWMCDQIIEESDELENFMQR